MSEREGGEPPAKELLVPTTKLFMPTVQYVSTSV